MEYCLASTEDFMKRQYHLDARSSTSLLCVTDTTVQFLFFGVINIPSNNLHHKVFNDGNMGEYRLEKT